MTKPTLPKDEADKASVDESFPLRTERTKAYRQRQTSKGEIRWELSISDKVKAEVLEIAKTEKLTASIAAGTLLALGIETYLATNRLSTADVLIPEPPLAKVGINDKPDKISLETANDVGSRQNVDHPEFSGHTNRVQDAPAQLLTPDSSRKDDSTDIGDSFKIPSEGTNQPTERASRADIFKGRKILTRSWK